MTSGISCFVTPSADRHPAQEALGIPCRREFGPRNVQRHGAVVSESGGEEDGSRPVAAEFLLDRVPVREASAQPIQRIRHRTRPAGGRLLQDTTREAFGTRVTLLIRRASSDWKPWGSGASRSECGRERRGSARSALPCQRVLFAGIAPPPFGPQTQSRGPSRPFPRIGVPPQAGPHACPAVITISGHPDPSG
jgi:hypothetical protein